MAPSNETNNMTYVNLGNSGLKVSRLVLGCMTYGTSKWLEWVLDEEEGMAHIKAAYDMGINTFDTANSYSNGLSEVVLGKAIREYNLPREEIVVMTKLCGVVKHDPYAYDFFRGGPEDVARERYINQRGTSRKNIFQSVKNSLERLQLEYVDVVQCHRFDPETPIEETMQALHDIVKAGHARYIGMSSCYAWQFHKMQNYARANNLTEFISMQNCHNAVYREEEREMTPLLQDLGVGMIPWSPLARGFLCRPAKDDTLRGDTDMFLKDYQKGRGHSPSLLINQRAEEVAKKHGVSMAQVALAWSLAKPYVTAPVVGTTKLEQLRDLCAGIHLKLSEEEVKYIDEPYEAQPIIGHWRPCADGQEPMS